ncbi:MAG: DUF512 domain-containing protein [Defluviitaleaceae bacterium]|nr:DUF512 domain-containing protein [Defluviitaleaceae bacterium]
MSHEIIKIIPNSIADEMEITPGDFLLQINQKKIKDILDYQFFSQEEYLTLEIQKPNNEIWELEIEKDAEEELGMIFKQPLMSAARRCANDCIFCFVAQQPQGLRESLYVKDDDIRLSFLHGNYVTLTNLSDAEITRIAGYHLSPLRISIHSTDITLRKKMMNNPSENLHKALTTFGAAGIKMHFQIVLCKGINDLEHLDEAITFLRNLKGAESLAVVPSGLTRHRDGLYPLKPFTPDDAKNVIAQINKYKNFVFASDEWYIMAGQPLPTYEHYDDFPQLDNGVGMIRLFEYEFFQGLKRVSPITAKNLAVGIITGEAAAEFMRGIGKEFERRHPAVTINVYPIKNNFFGENITVSGLLTGEDIIKQVKGRVSDDVLFLPQNAFRDGTDIMLDGTTLGQLSDALTIPVIIGSTNGEEFFAQLSERRVK